MVMRTCVCGNAGEKLCSRCKIVGYCSRECQAKDWKTHKPTCKIAPPSNSKLTEENIVASVEDANLTMWVALSVNGGEFLHGAEKDTVIIQALIQNTQKETIKVNPDTAYLMFENKRVKGGNTEFLSVNGAAPSAPEKQVILKQKEFTTVQISFPVGKTEKSSKEHIGNLQIFVLPLRVDGKGVVKIEASLSQESLQKLV